MMAMLAHLARSTMFALLLAGGCGKSAPPLYKHMPTFPTTPVAVGAVAAAAALTVANPDAAKPREDPDAPSKLKYRKSNEQMPGDVLDRLDAEQARANETDELPECEDVAPEPAGNANNAAPPGTTDQPAGAGKARLELDPDWVAREEEAGKAKESRARCRKAASRPDSKAPGSKAATPAADSKAPAQHP